MKNYAVIGLGFGDEGKGLVTSFLAGANPNHCVTRYSGGPQASHKVMLTEDNEYIFSNLGSGTLQGNHTYINKNCLVDPMSMLDEIIYFVGNKKIQPKVTIHAECTIITPYDIIANRAHKDAINHGTCGRGIGTTIQREEDFYSLKFADLYNKTALKIKLDLIAKYYNNNEGNMFRDAFLEKAEMLISYEKMNLCFNEDHLLEHNIFESSQGLLLDQNIGFFPHVTRGNVSTKNIAKHKPEVFLVTRAYQTRHGNGPMTNLNIPHNIKLSKYEHNISNKFQGDFKVSVLDLDLINYAFIKDEYIRENQYNNLVITCLDNIEEYKYTRNGKLYKAKDEVEFIYAIKRCGVFKKVYLSRTPFTNKLEVF